MPFQGNPNAGALDPALIQMLFDARRQRTELALKQQDAQMRAQAEAEKQRRLEEKHAQAMEAARLDGMTKRAAFLKTLKDDFGPQVDSARRHAETTTSRNFTEEDLFGGGGGEDFASMVAQLDPTAPAQLQASNESLANYRGTVNQAAELFREVDPSLGDQGAVSAALGLGSAAEAERARGVDLKVEEQFRTTDATKRAELPHVIASERRAESRAIAAEKRSVESQIRNAGRVAEAQERARFEAGDALIEVRHDLRKQIAQAEKEGRDTTLLNERLGLLNGRIRSIQDPNTVNNIKPMPAVERIKTIRTYRGASAGLNRTIELGQALDDGSIKVGAAGKVENFKLRAVGLLENLAQIDPAFDADVRSAIQDAIGSGQATVTLTTDAGNQLTLGLDQIQLTYDFIRNGRGGGDRITVGEIERVAKQLGFTDLLTTPDQIRGALKKVAKELAREKATAKAVYGAFDMNPGDLDGEEIFADDAQLIEMTFGGGDPRGAVDVGTTTSETPAVPANDPALEAARRLRDAQRVGTGGASGNP